MSIANRVGLGRRRAKPVSSQVEIRRACIVPIQLEQYDSLRRVCIAGRNNIDSVRTRTYFGFPLPTTDKNTLIQQRVVSRSNNIHRHKRLHESAFGIRTLCEARCQQSHRTAFGPDLGY